MEVSHIAPYCDSTRASLSQGYHVAAAATIVSKGAVQMSELVGN